MDSRIREIVEDVLGCACSQTAREREQLIAALEAYHYRAMVEAADGALMGRAMLDRALGSDVTLDVRPGSKSLGDAVSEYVAGMVDDLRVRRDVLAQGREPTRSTMLAVGDIIERNAHEWQHGPTESDDERARR